MGTVLSAFSLGCYEPLPRCFLVAKSPVPLYPLLVRAWRSRNEVWLPQTQLETLSGTLTLPQLPNKGLFQAAMCYHPNYQPSGLLKQL